MLLALPRRRPPRSSALRDAARARGAVNPVNISTPKWQAARMSEVDFVAMRQRIYGPYDGAVGKDSAAVAEARLQAAGARNAEGCVSVAKELLDDPESRTGAYPPVAHKHKIEAIQAGKVVHAAIVLPEDGQQAWLDAHTGDTRKVQPVDGRYVMLGASMLDAERDAWTMEDGDEGHICLDTKTESYWVVADPGSGFFPWGEDDEPAGTTYIKKREALPRGAGQRIRDRGHAVAGGAHGPARSRAGGRGCGERGGCGAADVQTVHQTGPRAGAAVGSHQRAREGGWRVVPAHCSGGAGRADRAVAHTVHGAAGCRPDERSADVARAPAQQSGA